MLGNISGFPELLPREQIIFNQVKGIIKYKFELYGFLPLDTRVVEKTNTLLANGNNKEIYGLYRLAGEANEKKDLGLRFDLTVPLARYVSQFYNQLIFPYRRYQIAPVWRGERPRGGRYRQFYQCDVDVIGEQDLSLIYDSELLAVIYEILNALNLKKFITKINNRKILTGLIRSFGILEEEAVVDIIRVIDKIDKIPLEQFKAELSFLAMNEREIGTLLDLKNKVIANKEWITYLRTITTDPEFQQGVQELDQVLSYAISFQVPEQHILIDPSLARGLNYYTGTTYETILEDYPSLGSICGGGRYANLSQNFTSQKLPGVGISIGLSRLTNILLENELFKTITGSIAEVIVTTQDPECINQYLQIAQLLRDANIRTEMYLQNRISNEC